MVEYGQGPRSGARDNGLRCAGYVAVGDIDPRVTDSLLDMLRAEGIAAYVTPTPAAHGGYLDVHLPSRPTDRLFADSEHEERARDLVIDEHGVAPAIAGEADHRSDQVEHTDPPTEQPADSTVNPDEIDFDAAWQQVLTSFQSTTSTTSRPWPASEEVERGAFATAEPGTLDEDPMLDEHFVPPPPPPLPRLRTVTVVGWLCILAGLVVTATGIDGGSLAWLGVASMVVGAATLIWHVKDGPPIDSGPDDGAVV
jgi:hypothetical protein